MYQYNTIQLYRLGVEGFQHIAKANNIFFFSKGKCGLGNVDFHERIVKIFTLTMSWSLE